MLSQIMLSYPKASLYYIYLRFSTAAVRSSQYIASNIKIIVQSYWACFGLLSMNDGWVRKWKWPVSMYCHDFRGNYSAIANLPNLQITTAPLGLFPASCVFNSRSLAKASNCGDYSSSRAHVVTVRRISRNCAFVNCQLNYSTISSQPPLQSSNQLPTLNWTGQLNRLQDNSSARNTSKTPFFYFCERSFPRERVYEPFLTHVLHNPVVLSNVACVT
jgi:hypothetical protein